MKKRTKIVSVTGALVPPFQIWTQVIAALPGSVERERVSVEQTLITDDGRIVLISTPYPNLAEKSS